MMRYYTIRTPRPDFTGEQVGALFVRGEARVSFDDTRDENGHCPADEHAIQVGRSAVLFAYRAAGRGYTLVETDAAGTPLVSEADAKPKAGKARG